MAVLSMKKSERMYLKSVINKTLPISIIRFITVDKTKHTTMCLNTFYWLHRQPRVENKILPD